MLPLDIARRPHIRDAVADLNEPGSRYRLATPAAIVDLDILEKNISAMRSAMAGKPVALRPHAKSNKCSRLAHMQMEAGAVGICCAKPGEAEALAEAGIESILITSPVVAEDTAGRVVRLAAGMRDLAVVVDHPSAVDRLGNAAKQNSIVLPVLIDVDVGHGRTGVLHAQGALQVGEAIGRHPSLKLRGVQGYGGNWQHVAGAGTRRQMTEDGMRKLSQVIEALRAGGFSISAITGGGTGTLQADLTLGVLNEIQPGSYIFMDRQYHDALGKDQPHFETSLFIQTRVVSVNHADYVTVDGGLKAFSTEGPAPKAASRGFENSAFHFFGDEHGRLGRPAGIEVSLGERIEFEVPHCDPTIDRYDVLHLVRGNTLAEIVPIEARGRSQ
jgi:D-serine deaminase-like pyridoxal phosphate-dependent protein